MVLGKYKRCSALEETLCTLSAQKMRPSCHTRHTQTPGESRLAGWHINQHLLNQVFVQSHIVNSRKAICEGCKLTVKGQVVELKQYAMCVPLQADLVSCSYG